MTITGDGLQFFELARDLKNSPPCGLHLRKALTILIIPHKILSLINPSYHHWSSHLTSG